MYSQSIVLEPAPNDAPSHRDKSQSPKPPIEVKGQGHICKKLLLLDGVPNKKNIHGLIGLEPAPNDAPSHRDGSQSPKLPIEVKGQGHICKKLLMLDGVPNKKCIHDPIGLQPAANDAPSHRDGSQSPKPPIDVKGQGHICKKLLLLDGVPDKKIIHGPIGLEPAPNDAPSHRDGSQSPKPPIEVKG